MKTDKDKKPNRRFANFSWNNRLIAGTLAVLLFTSIVFMGGSANPFMLKMQETKPAAAAEPSSGTQEVQQTTEAPETGASETALSGGAASGTSASGTSASTAPTEESDPYAYWLSKAGEAAEAKDYGKALTYLSKCELLAPDDKQLAMVLDQKGILLFKQGEYSGAQECFYRILKLDQTEYPPSQMYSLSAKCRLLREDPKGAAEDCALGLSKLQKNDEYEAELYVLRGTANVYLGKYSLASSDYSMAIEKGYADKETLYEQISLCSYLVGDYAQTAQAGEQVISANVWKSMSYYALGAYDKAADAFETLLGSGQTYLTTAQIYSSIAKCRVLLGEYDEAIAKCTLGLQTQDANETATLYALRGTAYMAKNVYPEAVNNFMAAIGNGYDDPASLYTQCAACCYYMGSYNDAIKYGITAQDGSSADTEAVLWTALSYYELDDYVNAEPWIDRSLNITQSYCTESELYRCLARCRLTQSDYEGAAKYATLGIDNSSGTASGDLYAIRGAAYQSLGTYDKALEDFYAAIALGYADPYEMYRQCTLCNFLLGDYEQAVSCGERALENGTKEEGTLYYWIGISYFSLKEYKKGKQALTKAAELDDSPENLYFYLGICCFSLEEYETAAKYFSASADRAETTERSIYNRALCYLQLGKYDDAKKDLESVASQQEDQDIAADAAKLLESLKAGS